MEASARAVRLAVVMLVGCAALLTAMLLSHRYLHSVAAVASNGFDGSDQKAKGLAPAGLVAGARALQQRRARIIFFAGLEGSGHHFLEAVYRKLSQNKTLRLQKLSVPGFRCSRIPVWDAKRFELIKKGWSKLSPDVLYTLPQQMSYPYCGLKHHDWRRDKLHPDIDFFGRAADAAGADLHVIFLFRPLAASLLAGCVHRHFEGCTPYAETLVKNADFLAKGLAAIGAERYHCFKYGDVGSMSRAVDLAYGPTMSARPTIKQIFREKRPSARQEAKKRVGDVWFKRMSSADHTFIEMCAHGRTLSSGGLMEMMLGGSNWAPSAAGVGARTAETLGSRGP